MEENFFLKLMEDCVLRKAEPCEDMKVVRIKTRVKVVHIEKTYIPLDNFGENTQFNVKYS